MYSSSTLADGSGRAPLVTSSIDRPAVGLPWLARLRWGAVVGQLTAIALVTVVLRTPLPLARLLPLVAATIVTNVMLHLALRRGAAIPSAACGAILLFDIVVLTGLLQATGGPMNPFSILYLVHITLAAVLLGGRWTRGLAALSIGCYGALFIWHVPLGASVAAHHAHPMSGTDLSAHLQGMWVAFALAAALTAYFVVQLTEAIEARDRQIAAVRERAGRYERLAALTTLAAGAAHELGTPLATIAVAARELERSLEPLADTAAARATDDARLIRSQVDRCRTILDAMMRDAGGPSGEAPAAVTLDDVLTDALRNVVVSDSRRVLRQGHPVAGSAALPRRAVAQAVANLVRNALEATAPRGIVRVEGEARDGTVAFVVRDHGPGLPPEIRERCGEPFVSTKGGSGMGLGIYLARSLAETLGGRLVLDSRPGDGLTATLEVPRVAATAEGAHGRP